MNTINAKTIDRKFFDRQTTGLTMDGTYGSNFDGFSAGGYVFASKATFNILAPAACMVGSYFKGTL